jgi:hypothetical protein
MLICELAILDLGFDEIAVHVRNEAPGSSPTVRSRATWPPVRPAVHAAPTDTPTDAPTNTHIHCTVRIVTSVRLLGVSPLQ